MSLANFLPVLQWGKNYQRAWLKGDVSAGLTVGIMLIPQGMAYAMLAGLPPIHGLYAATLPLVVYAVLGTSRQLAVGPVAMDSLLTAAALGTITVVGTEQYVLLAALLALLVGVVQLLGGALRLGFLVDLLSRPIISGFTSAAAIIIGMSQLKHLLGIELGGNAYVHEILLAAWQKMGEVNLAALGLGLGGIALILLVKRFTKAIPGALVAVVAGILAVWGLGLAEEGVKIVGEIPEGLPALSWPELRWDQIRQLIPAALTISLVGFMESIAVAKAVRNRHKDYDLDANQELIALGAANAAAAVISGYPVTGGFSRTAVNDQSGAKTGLASIISALLILLTLLFLTPLFYYLPNAILASLIMVAVFKLIDWREAGRLWRLDRSDFWLLAITFFTTLFLGIQLGIGLGVALSLGVHIYRSMRPHLAVLGNISGTEAFRNVDRFAGATEVPGTLIVRFDGRLYFANLTYFQAQLNAMIEARVDTLKTIIINAEGISGIDSSAMYEIRQFVETQHAKGLVVVFAGLIGPVRDLFKKNDLTTLIGNENFYLSVPEAVAGAAASQLSSSPYALQAND